MWWFPGDGGGRHVVRSLMMVMMGREHDALALCP